MTAASEWRRGATSCLAADRRLLMSVSDEGEWELFGRIGLLGEIPPHEGADGYSVAVTNAATVLDPVTLLSTVRPKGE